VVAGAGGANKRCALVTKREQLPLAWLWKKGNVQSFLLEKKRGGEPSLARKVSGEELFVLLTRKGKGQGASCSKLYEVKGLGNSE